MYGSHHVCVGWLLICALLLNACTSIVPTAPASPTRPEPAIPDMAAPWSMDSRSRSEDAWQAFENSVRADLSRHPGTERIEASLIHRAQIPGEAASAVAVKLANAGPHLTEIFAANLHALADAGFETFTDPALALPESAAPRTAMVAYRMPSPPNVAGGGELVVLQYVVSTEQPDAYWLYSLTIGERLFAEQVLQFRQWVLDLQQREEVPSPTVLAPATSPGPFSRSSLRATGQALVKPTGFAPPQPGQSPFPLALDELGTGINSDAGHLLVGSNRYAPVMPTARRQAPPSVDANQCITAYNRHRLAVSRAFAPVPQAVAGLDASPQEIQAAAHNVVAPEKAVLRYYPEADQELVWAEITDLLWAGEARQPADSEDRVSDSQGVLSRTEDSDGGQSPKDKGPTFFGGIQACLDWDPNEEGAEGHLAQYDECHDGVVTTLSMAIALGQVAGVATAGIGTAALEIASMAVDYFDVGFNVVRLTTCMSGSSVLGTKRLSERSKAWPCGEDLINVLVGGALAAMPLLPSSARRFLTPGIKRLEGSQDALTGLAKWSAKKIAKELDKYLLGKMYTNYSATESMVKETVSKVSRPHRDLTAFSRQRELTEYMDELLKEQPYTRPRELADITHEWLRDNGHEIPENALPLLKSAYTRLKGANKLQSELSNILKESHQDLTEAGGFEGLVDILTAGSSSESEAKIPGLPDLRLPSRDWAISPNPRFAGIADGSTNLSLPFAVRPALGSRPAAEEDVALDAQSLLLLALYMLSSHSEGGGELTAAEAELLASASLTADIAPDQRDTLLHNVAELATGQADLAVLAALEAEIGALREATAEFQGTVDAIANELAVLDASLNTERLPGVPARRHVARPLDYLLVDRETGFEIRGVTRPSGLGDAVWLGPERIYTVVYYDQAEELTALTSFKTNAELATQLVPPVLGGSLDSPDTDGDGLTDLGEWVLGFNPEARTPQEEWDTGSNTSGLLTQADTPGYAMDICAVAPAQLAVADVHGGLALFQVDGDTLQERHTEPQETFGDDLVAVHCDPYQPGRLLAETLAGALLSVSVGEGLDPSVLQDIRMVSLPPQGTTGNGDETKPVTPYWRSVALTPDWVFMGDNLGRLQGMPAIALDTPGDSPQGPPDPMPLLTLEHPIEHLAFQLDTLYVLTSRALHTYLVLEEGDEPKLHPLGHAWVPGNPAPGEWQRPMSVQGNRIHVGSRQGLTTLDATDPLDLQVVGWPNVQHGMIRDLWPVSDSLLLAVVQYAVTETPFLAVLDVSPRHAHAAPVWLLPGTGQLEHLTMIDGTAYTATGTEGITAWNALGVQSAAPDLLPVLHANRTPGGWEAGGNVTFQASTAGKSLLRRVELYQGGEQLLTDATAPFTFALAHGNIPNPADPTHFELVYVDDKGQRWEESFSLETVADAQPPRLLEASPPQVSLGGTSETETTLSLRFSEPVILDEPEDKAVQVLRKIEHDEGFTSFEEVPVELRQLQDGTVVQVVLPASVTAGSRLLLALPGVRDGAGNSIPQALVREYVLDESTIETAPKEEASILDSVYKTALTARFNAVSPVGTDAGQTITVTGAGGSRGTPPIALSVGLSSHIARSNWRASQFQARWQAVPAFTDDSDDNTEELFAAVNEKDVEKVRQLLAAETNPNAQTQEDWTVLLQSSRLDNMRLGTISIVTERPLTKGITPGGMVLWPETMPIVQNHVVEEVTEPILRQKALSSSRSKAVGRMSNQVQEEDDTTLLEAVGRNDTERVRALLAAGTNPNERTDNNQTPLHLASEQGHTLLAEILLEHGAEANARMNDGMTPLLFASQNGHVPTIKILLSHGAEVSAQHLDGWTPLHVAAHRNRVEAVKVLLAYGANVHIRNNKGKTPLYDAVAGYWGRHVEAARVLLAHGADPNARKSDGMSPLIDAVQGGDGHVEMIRLLLAHGAEVNARHLDGWTALHAAAHRNHVEAVKVLLTYGADVHACNDSGKTPLYDAVAGYWGRHVEAARVLLAHGADPNARKSDGMSPLHDAVQGGDGHVEMIRLLLAHGAEVNAQHPDGWTPLHAAAHRNHVEAVKVLLAHGADVRIRNNGGKTPLYDAVAGRNGRHVEAARVLLAQGSDPNARKSDGMSPLHDAVQGGDGHVEMIRLLLAHGADVNAQHPDGWTALHAAAHRNHVDAVEVLLAHGADVRIRNRWGKTPLYDAVAGHGGRHVEAARVLLAHGADPNARKSDGMSPLIDAAQGGDGHVEMIRLLLANGAEVNARHPDGWTALHAAAHRNHVEAVEVLLAHGADVRIRNNGGKTPLYDAVAGYRGRYVEAARVLLAHGADPNVRRSDGMTPLIDAAHGGDNHVEIIRLLLANGAEVNARHPDGWTALHAAAHRNHVEAVEVLLANGADVRIRNNGGKTPLYDAVAGYRGRYVEAARVLLAHGADPNTRRSDGMTPLIDAAHGGDNHVEMIRLLLANGAEVNARHPNGRTALDVAKERGQEDAVSILLAHGADPGDASE